MAEKEKKFIEHPLIKPGKIESRLYQQLIFAEAVNKNLLAVLPTALGKTVIAVMLSAHFLERYPDRKILVMAPTRPLVLQHFESFSEMMNLGKEELTAVTGKIPWRLRRAVWKTGRIFFSTPQVVKNDVERGILSLEKFSLLVFDEAHRAVRNYSYTFIARRYVEQCSYPIILALTASPGGDPEKIREVCRALFIEKVVYKTEQDEDVKSYVHGAEVEWKAVKLPAEYRSVRSCLRKLLEARIKALQGMGLIKKPLARVTRSDVLELGERLRSMEAGGKRGWIYRAFAEQSACLSAFHALELLESQGIQQLRRFLLRIREERGAKKSYEILSKDAWFSRALGLAERYKNRAHPKMDELAKILSAWNGSAIVFAQFRDTVREIVEFLRARGMSAERFVGQASREEDPGLTQDQQAEVLKRFRNGEVRFLVATSVAEEGLDIPSVGLVVFYEPVPSEIRFIQRKGRTGRIKSGKVVILAAEGTLDVAHQRSAVARVRKMRRALQEINKELKPIERARPLAVVEAASSSVGAGVAVGAGAGAGAGVKYMPSKPAGPPVTEPFEETVEIIDASFMAEVARAEKWIIGKLRRSGRVYMEDLFEEAAELGFSKHAVKLGAERLCRRGLAYFPRWDRIEAASSRERDVYEVVVERVYYGGATLIVNGRFRAKLLAEEFPGGSGLIKKNARLRVRGTLYKKDGVLHLRVVDVLL